jgi:hypothetical protein
MTHLYYLVLLHISSTMPVGAEGPYAPAKCWSLAHERTTYDDHNDDSVLSRQGFQWLCFTPDKIALFVKVNHCMASTPMKSKAGGVSHTYDCLGK